MFPYKHESYAETCRSGLLPQRFILPVSWKSHCGWVNSGVLREQSLDIFCEGVGWNYAVEPIGDIAQMRIELERVQVPVRYPRQSGLSRQFWHNWETAVPNTGVVGTLITQDGDAGQPTTQDQMLRQSEILCHQVLCCIVGKVGIEFRNGSKCKDFKCFPCRGILRYIVFRKMLRDEVFL